MARDRTQVVRGHDRSTAKRGVTEYRRARPSTGIAPPKPRGSDRPEPVPVRGLGAVPEQHSGLSEYGLGVRARRPATAQKASRPGERTYHYDGQVLVDGGTLRRRVTETGRELREAPSVVVQRGTRPGSPITLISLSWRDRATGRCVHLAMEDDGRGCLSPQVTVHTGDEQVIFVETPPELMPRRAPWSLRKRGFLPQALGVVECLRDAPGALGGLGVDASALDFTALVDADSPEALMRQADLVI